MKRYLVARGMQHAVPFLNSHTPETMIRLIDTLRHRGIERMKQYHKGTAEDLERRVDAANAFFEMAKRKMPELSPATQRKLTYNIFFNALHLGDEKREAYFRQHGEYPPFFLLVSPSMACNLRCHGCYAWKHPKSESLSRETVSELVREGKEEMGIYFVILTGGEPTFWPHLEEVAAEHEDVFFLVYTHGMTIDDARAARWGEMGNIHPAISIEGGEAFTDARRGGGAYGKILAAMDRLKRHGVLFGNSITHTRLNHDSTLSDDFVATLVDHGAAFAWYFQYVPVGQDPDWEMVPTADQRLERRERVFEIRRNRPLLAYDFFNDGDSIEGCIAWGRKYVHVTAQGLVEPCVFVHFAEDSIHEKSLGECIRGRAFTEMRTRQPFGCDHRRPCPQIDHPEELKRLVETYDLRPTHDGAEKVVTDHHRRICSIAEDFTRALEADDAARGDAPSRPVENAAEVAGE
jgi:MoaA/NifB/PqqE/SkfB family radical SAM enzyme